MKNLLLFFFVLLSSTMLFAQDAATTHAEFMYQGKSYIANYDEAKHLLTMNEEVSIIVYDETGTSVKRTEGKTLDLKSLLKTEDATFTIRFYKKSKGSKKKKNASIKQKGEIGFMVIKDHK